MAKEDEQRRALLRDIFDTECDAFAEAMYLCADAERRGDPLDARFQAFLAHRRECLHCRMLYRELLAMLTREAEEGLMDVTAPDIPLPAQARPAREAFRREQRLPAALQQGVAWTLQQTAAGASLLIELAQLAVGGQLQPQIRGADLSAGQGATIGELSVDVDAETLGFGVDVQLRLLADVADASLATLVAEVSLPDRWPDFSHLTVTLHAPGAPPKSQITDQGGLARFPRLRRDAIGQMRLAVELRARR